MKLHVVIDTREKLPYEFKHPPKGDTVVIINKKLDVGDYSIEGFENKVCIERKSKGDLFGTVGRRSSQFRQNLVRMKAMAGAYVVVERPSESILKGPDYYIEKEQKPGKPKPLTKQQYGSRVYNTTIGWEVFLGVPFKFFNSRQQAEYWVIRYLLNLRKLLR